MAKVRYNDRRDTLRPFKLQLGFGRWSVILVSDCPTCGTRNRMVKNWNGARPNGGGMCVGACGNVIPFYAYRVLYYRGEYRAAVERYYATGETEGDGK